MTTPDPDLKAAEEYAGRSRCAQVTQNDKEWHRLKAAFLAGAAHARAALEAADRIAETVERERAARSPQDRDDARLDSYKAADDYRKLRGEG